MAKSNKKRSVDRSPLPSREQIDELNRIGLKEQFKKWEEEDLNHSLNHSALNWVMTLILLGVGYAVGVVSVLVWLFLW